MPRSDWNRLKIRAALLERGFSLKGLSERHGYAPNAATLTLGRPWPAVERIIADAIGVDPWEIWPSRYQKAPKAQYIPRSGVAGNRKRRRARASR